MSDCATWDAATVQRLEDGSHRWLHAPVDIHIAPELLIGSEAREFIEANYEIRDYCAEQRAFHAHRKDAAE